MGTYNERSPSERQYLSLIQNFLTGKLATASFCAKFTKLWMRGRDIIYAKKASWPQPYDELLFAAWQRGEISDSDFRREDAKLWGYKENDPFQNMINETHSAFSVYNPSPKLEGEIDEEQLRDAVKKSLANYEELNTVHPLE